MLTEHQTKAEQRGHGVMLIDAVDKLNSCGEGEHRYLKVNVGY